MHSKKKVRVRFAPSPTGPLHIGGVRTALYNYLFARKHEGTFILRIEDTDQTRYVEGAEKYIIEALNWIGLRPDESVENEGEVGPYRQSERKEIYQKHVNELLKSGHAYYAFDTTDDLEAMRAREQANGVHSPKYDQRIRLTMKNSLTLSTDEVSKRLIDNDPVTVRMKIPEDEVITFTDEIRGEVSFRTEELDDKVILKADGLPTYHLANVVDDKLMQISHVIRGEEWLSSTAHHVMLYRSFGWQKDQPLFAHLPLILKPSGKGKLSKRDGAKFGFPVFPLEWHDAKSEEIFSGFREEGFLPEALINFIALLGWNPGTEDEMFSLEQLCQLFSEAQINKSGAQFNYDKAQWFNQQYIINTPTEELYQLIKNDFPGNIEASYVKKVIDQLKPRVTFLKDFIRQSSYFFEQPQSFDEKGIRKKFKPELVDSFESIASLLNEGLSGREAVEQAVKGYINDHNLKFGDILPVLRILIAGTMSGPDLFEMINIIGTTECAERIRTGLVKANEIKENG